MKSGRLPLALRLANGYQGDPLRNMQGQFALACIYDLTGDVESLRAALEASIRLDPDFTESRRLRAALRRREEDYPGAIEDYGVVLNQYPEDIRAREGRGLSCLLAGDPAGAVADLSKVLAELPWRVDAALGCADALDDLGRIPEAHEVLQAALAHWSSFSEERARLVAMRRRLKGE